MLSRIIVAASLAWGAAASVAHAQMRPVTRADAIASALGRGPRLAITRADSGAAGAALFLARQYENPALTLEHTRSTPRQHLSLQLPLWVPAQRSLQIRSASALLDAATMRFTFEREAITFDADTSYTNALVARERSLLSARSAADADSLVVLARIRRDAGDASELDVQLATLSSGQFANAAALDSLGAASALLSVQSAMGLSSRSLAITVADSLDAGSTAVDSTDGTPLLVAAAEAASRAAELAVSLERGRLFLPPSLSFGFERQEPGGTGNQILPAIGMTIPLPLLNRNRAGVLVAQAQRDRSAAQLLLTRVEVSAALALADRERVIARERVVRTQSLVGVADRVAALSLLAYREGASTLQTVLEAQRSARDTRTQYVEAVGALRNATARLRLLALTSHQAGQ